MTTASSVIRRGVLCVLTLGVLTLAPRPAAADLVLFDKDGWTFFTDGRINTFFSGANGDDFPQPTPNIDPATGMIRDPSHQVIGKGQPFTAGFPTEPQGADGKYQAARLRSGFLGTIIAFGMKRQATEWTTLKSYVALWATAETNARNRTSDNFAGGSPDFSNPYRGFDVREGWVGIDGPWGGFVAGKQGGILGGISTEIDFLYGHNYGLGLPCVEFYFPSCGHIGTGALGNGVAAGFTYTTPAILGGLKFKGGLYDPVRLLGGWERAPYPRPEGALWYERRLSPSVLLKVQIEGMYQYIAVRENKRSDKVWGVAGGARLEAGPLRLGVSAYHGKGLGAYIALQNAASTFDQVYRDLRNFTGVYAQLALVLGREQLSAGIGRVMDHQLDSDKNGHPVFDDITGEPVLDANGNQVIDLGTAFNNSNLKYQTGISAAFYHHVTDTLVLGIDYFRFQTDWWGARNAVTDPTTFVTTLLPGFLPGEKQVVHFLNVGATFHW